MRKILLFVFAACLVLVGCKKEQPRPDNGNGSGIDEWDTVYIDFTPYQVTPMKSSAVSAVCSRLDIYIIDLAENDTLRIHQSRDVNGTGFGTASAVLKTNKTYRLLAVAHNSADTCTFSAGIVSFTEEKTKQSMVADTVFCPGDGLSLSVEMKRFVGMFKLRVADELPAEVTHFQFVVDSAYSKWNVPLAQGVSLERRTATITNLARGTDGYVTLNVYLIPDDLTATRTVSVTVTALDAQEAVVEQRVFEAVPIRAGYITKYTGTFFITFDMGFTFLAGDWNEFPDQEF